MGHAGLRGLIWDIWDKRRAKIVLERTNQNLMDLQELEEDLWEV